MGKQSSVKYKKHKKADYKSVVQVGEDTGALCGHSGWLHCCAPCSQSFALASDLWHCFISFLRTNVLDTRDHLRFAGIYQEVLSASWAAAETNMKKERIPSKKKKKKYHAFAPHNSTELCYLCI